MIDRSSLVRQAANRFGRPRTVRRRGRLWIGVLALLVSPLSAGRDLAAQDVVSITGQVVNAITGDPIPGVAVTLASRGLSLHPGFQLETDGEGRFRLPSIAVGSYRLELEHPRYNPSVGDFTVVRPGAFVTAMQPAGRVESDLVTGIVGVLADAETGSLLSGVAVRAGSGPSGTFTDLRGEFVFDELTPGQHVLEFSMIGYAPRADTVRVTPGRVTNVRVSLSVDPVALEPIEVSVERREVKLHEVDFYRRRATGFGKYIDRQEIERRGPMDVTELLTGMPGVEIYPDPINSLQKYVVLRSGRLPFPTTGQDGRPGYDRCFPTVYVDGIRTIDGGSEPARLDSFLNTMSIAGIEVYTSEAGLPAQYGRGTFCGVILVWTRVTGKGTG